ncbi:penicillin-insensitive murein endopeptidase [Cohaesibacter celericrescens]|uniref:Penicillin-insensitive murein endopeptidase n=1 Tax=Cohaesibacter celericrescens TaxID=2067669 RepID=A0A2N5XNM0_9HYPH|nr:penicillin-insensitive murein endopeptidase [Cohaesibacter celericrescens]PLW76119.1 penicillin-insensitive murein endopeptidase [Cohaesibacter celericrescens]
MSPLKAHTPKHKIKENHSLERTLLHEFGGAFIGCVISLVVMGGFTADPAYAQTAAKQLFGKKTAPANLQARAIGSYAKGCLAGARALSIDGPAWQAMRLSRNRNWGHPNLIAFIEKLAVDAKTYDGWNGLLVGDLAQPRGGPMISGHASHQIGLDADIWLRPMPDRRFTRKEREEISAISMLKKGTRTIDPKKFTMAHFRLIKRAASTPGLARIFVHPGIKKALCDRAGSDRAWLRQVRPWYGHHYHFHIRMSCPAGSTGCKNQAPPPAGDGCGKELSWWLSDDPWTPKKPKKGAPKVKPKKKRQITLSDLPQACSAVLDAAPVTGLQNTSANPSRFAPSEPISQLFALPRSRPLQN